MKFKETAIVERLAQDQAIAVTGSFPGSGNAYLCSPHPSLFSCCRCSTETQFLVEGGDLRNVGSARSPRSGSGQSGSQHGDWQRELGTLPDGHSLVEELGMWRGIRTLGPDTFCVP